MNPLEVKEGEVGNSLLAKSINSGEKNSESKGSSDSSRNTVTAIMVFFGLINYTTLRVNLTIALVDMISNKIIVTGNQTVTYASDFDWNSKTQSFVLNVFFYGYITGTFFSHLVTKYGGMRMYGICTFGQAMLTIFVPLTLHIHFYLFVVGRFFEGVFAVLIYVSSSEIWAIWSFSNNGPKLVSYTLVGTYIGTCIVYPIGGYLTHHYGWRAVFFITGGIAAVWSILWFILSAAGALTSPDLHLQESRKKVTKNIPWKDILKSIPVNAISISKFSYAWAYAIFLMYFPLYIKDVTSMDISKVGILSSIPAFVSVFMVILFGNLMHCLQSKKKLSATSIHKLYICLGLILGGVSIIVTAFVSNFIIGMVCLSIFGAAICAAQLSLQLLPGHVAPEYASVVSGLTSFWYTIALILSPLFIGFIVVAHDQLQWRIVFTIAAGVMLLGAIVFLIFGSSERQPWSRSGKSEQNGMPIVKQNKNNV